MNMISTGINNNLRVFWYALTAIFLLFCLSGVMQPAYAETTPAPTPAPTKTEEKINIGLVDTAKKSGDFNVAGIGTITGRAISIVLSMVGVAYVVLMVYAGFLYMTARGNQQAVDTAKNIFTGATLGVVIILTSYYLIDFVFEIISQGFTGETPPVTE